MGGCQTSTEGQRKDAGDSDTVSNRPHCVALVVDPMFGERLAALSNRLHVWIVISPANRAVAERIWRDSDSIHSLECGFTTFDASAEASSSEVAADQLSSIDLHHGEYSRSPPWSLLEIYGTEPTFALIAALREYGLTEIIDHSGFFIAWSTSEGAG